LRAPPLLAEDPDGPAVGIDVWVYEDRLYVVSDDGKLYALE
jgi:hypothetical protein